MNIDERSDYAWLAITAAADSYTACIWAPFNHPFGFTIREHIYSPKLLLSGPVNTNERSADLAMEKHQLVSPLTTMTVTGLVSSTAHI